MSVQVKDPTDIQSAYDNRATNPTTQTGSDLSGAEQRGSDAAYVNSGLDQLEAYANDPANHIKEGEEASMGGGGWEVNRSSGLGASRTTPQQRILKGLKKGGPTAGIVGGLIAAVFGISSLASPALLLNHLVAGFLDKWDTRTTTATIRTNKMIVKKMVGDATSGSCSYVKIACRYNKPSNALLKKLEKQGITAVDSAGNSVRTSGLWPNNRPDHLEFTRSNGVTSKISAAELATTLQNDAEFRKAFHAAYNTRFQNFADSVYKRVLARFGTSKADELADVTDTKSAEEKLNTVSEGEDLGTKAAQQEGGDAADSVIKKLLGDELSDIFKKIGKAGKGDAVGLVAGGACLVADGPGLATKVVRTYQMAQLVKFAMVFLTLADKIKAGNATSEEVSAAGSLLTTTYKDSNGNVTNRAAVDSFGVKNALYGDTSTAQETSGHSYTKFQPGGSIVASLSGITSITDSKLKKDACNVATNPLTGAAINIALTGTGAGIVVAGVNIAVGMAVGTAIEKLATPLAESAATLLKPAFSSILGGLLGDLTANVEGEDLGNALASGVANMLGQASNAGGNVPMSVSDATSFKSTQNEVNLAYAEEDRVNTSPLDASNPNTFLGSIVTKFIPYASQMASVSGIFSTISSIALGSFGSIFSSSTKADANQEYALCKDSSINDGSIAVGSFCNIIYGIPKEYLNTDPDEVRQYLSGDIDEETGDPKPDSNLEIWMTTCLDGKTDQAVNCKINGPGISAEDSKRFAYYALYTVDHQIQKDMDDEDTASTDSGASTGTASGKCPANTKDYGTKQGYLDGKEIDINTCGIVDWPANFANSAGDKIVEVNATIAQKTADMAAALKKTGYNYTASVGFRTNEQQQCIFDYYTTGTRGCSMFTSKPPKAANAGYSNHQMGYSIDVPLAKGSKADQWLNTHMSEYGFSRDVSGDYAHITNKSG